LGIDDHYDVISGYTGLSYIPVINVIPFLNEMEYSKTIIFKLFQIMANMIKNHQVKKYGNIKKSNFLRKRMLSIFIFSLLKCIVIPEIST